MTVACPPQVTKEKERQHKIRSVDGILHKRRMLQPSYCYLPRTRNSDSDDSGSSYHLAVRTTARLS